MDKRGTAVLLMLFGGLFVSVFGFLGLAAMALKHSQQSASGEVFEASSGPAIGVLEVKGAITNLDKQIKQLRKLAKDSDVHAIVMRVDSPGGAVAPSQELHDEVRRVVASGKPVVVSMGNAAASGGYYISCPASLIVAEPGTLTASIGVITQLPDFSKLLDKVEVKFNTFTSGALKDSGSPYRPMEEKDRTYFQAVVQDLYVQFLTAVAEGRKLDVEKVRPYADGRVLTGKQAKELGFVDQLGGYHDAIDAAWKLAKLEGEPRVIQAKDQKGGMLRQLLDDEGEAAGRALFRGIRGELAPAVESAGPQFMAPFAPESR